jgi:hypothetical protein
MKGTKKLTPEERRQLFSKPIAFAPTYISSYYGILPRTDTTAPKFTHRMWSTGQGPDSDEVDSGENHVVYFTKSSYRMLRHWSLARLIEVDGERSETNRRKEDDMSIRNGMKDTECAICGVWFFGYGADARPIARGWACDTPRVEDGETIQPCSEAITRRRIRDAKAKATAEAAAVAAEEVSENS